ncbi:hypothetical protein C380_08550 [Acidovorax sp. KKS102]|uniref:DUF4406 domain-containing protein n=1 Tax=Acidovorax sp. KKS102 TaxID=358220 RepID=UPI00028BB589|nr:DUF4406 domain-containing protein [Acidovorax sp. KKS102]AFU45412.1 hypothetical protein C380_08550 [Acidovorax sp. KKS102]
MTNQQAPEAPSYEHQRAIMVGERNASLDAYSRVVYLTQTESRIYEAAFTNGWNRLAALVEAQQPAPSAAGPCVICGSDDPFTGTCGSSDQRALCKQPAPSAAAGAGQEPPGIHALMCVISSLRDTAHFSDEEGEVTDDLRTLRDWALAQAAAPQPSPTPQADSAPAEAVQRIVHLRTDRERRVYVAGPMTGLPEYNFPLFNATAARLRSEGWHVENPAEHGHVEGAGWADYLRWDISRIATCGAIYLLPGWSKSKGATLEVHIASVLGLQVLLADGAESPTAQPAPAATPTAASLAWNALRDLTGPLGEDGVKIMGHIRTYAQRQYEAGLAEGRAAPAATPQADSQPAPEPADIIAGALQTSRGHAMELMQQAVDADRAARAAPQPATADAVDAERWRELASMVEEIHGGDDVMTIELSSDARPAPHLKSLLEFKFDYLAAQREVKP